jgi:hypothetical protein
VPFNEAPFLTAAKADVEAIRIAVATATSFLGVVFIWVLGVWGIIVLVWSKKISLGLTDDEC